MLSAKEKRLENIANNWRRHSESDSGKEQAKWTTAFRCLDGQASEEEWDSLDMCYASYDGDFTYVVPGMESLSITGPDALVAWNRVTS